MKNLTYKISLLILGLFAAAFAADAQQIRGVVSDVNGEPLTGVSVFVDGTTLGVSTGVDGDYSLNVPDAKGRTLVFSMIGMATKEVVIGNNTVIDVVLDEDSNFLAETVVIGYATVKRRDLMGSVSSVDNKSLTQVPVASVTEALSGRMAGVQVTATEGDPDAEIKIRVRGGGSITQDSSPLYIVDGFPVESISDIPASDIQSIDVLKDAFSTAIYGSRGANGVVLVTTKSGASGKVSVSYNAYYGQKKMANKDAIQVMTPDEFVKLQWELGALRDNHDEEYIPAYGLWEDIDQYAGMKGNDWVQQVFGRTGTTFNHNLSVSGSTDKVKWTASYAHIGDKAIMLGSDYTRDNLTFKTQYKPVKQLTFDINARYSRTEVMGSGSNSINDSGSTSGTSARLKHAVQYTPIPVTGVSADSELDEDYGENAPPLQSVADNDRRRIRKNWTLNGSVTWHIIKNLNLKVEGGLDDYSQEDNRFYGLTTYYVGNTATIKNQPANLYSNRFRTKIRNTNTLSYNFSDVFADDRHKLDLLLGQEYILTKSNNLSTTVEGFPSFFTSSMAWNFMASGTSIASNNYFNANDKLLSFFGRVNYDFDSRYSVSATVRADGSSKFAKGNQWGVFPSAAASWTISNEPWMEDASSWLDNMKLRYSYGTAGNNNIPTGVSSMTFSANPTTWLSNTDTYWTTTKVGGKTIMPNPDLTWETTLSHNLGLDLSFLKGRINATFELYHNTTKDLLIQFPTAGSGYDYQYQNIGSTQNKGFEASVNFVVFEKKNFGLTLGGNISLNQNKVLSLGGLSRIDSESMWASTELGPDYVVLPGQPLGQMYGYQVEGRYSASEFTYDGNKWVPNEGTVDASGLVGSSFFGPGSVKIKDISGPDGQPDGKIDTNDKTVIGNALPLGTGGFNLSGYLYGFDFAANFNYVFGNDIYNANKIEFSHSRKYTKRNLIKNMSTDQRWTNVDWATGELITDAATLDALNAGTTMWSPACQNAIFTDWAVEDGSFLRLTSATIGYTLPQKWTMKIKMQKLRFYVTGTNLFCLTNYSGYDPEVDTRRSTPLTPGVDYAAYPKSIGWVVGANITF